MADKEVKLTLKVDAAGAIKTTTQVTTGIKEVDKAQAAYTKALSEQGQTVKAVNAAKRSLVKQQELEKIAANEAKGSYNQLSAQYRLNVIQLNAMGKAERETTEHGKKLTAETLQLRVAMSDAKKETGDNTLNVGNYTDSVKDALAQTGLFGKLLAAQTKAQALYSTIQKASTNATKSGTSATKKFGYALTATGIGAIVVVLGMLVAAFMSTQQGMDSVNKALAPLKGAFEAIKGILQDLAMNVFEQLTERWTLAVNSIANGVDNIRLKWNKLTGDAEAVAEIQKDIEERTNAIAKAQKKLNDLSKKGTDIWKGAYDRVKDGAETQQKVYDLGIKIRENEITLNKRKAELNDKLRENQKISRDSALSDKERLEAAKKAIDLTNELQKVDQDHLDMRIEKMKLEHTLNETDDAEKKELADLEAERIQAATQQKATEIRLLEQKNSLEKKLAQERIDEIEGRKQAQQEAADEEAEMSAIVDAQMQEDEDKELERIRAFDKAKKQLEEDLRLEEAESEQEREEIQAELDAEKKEEELANLVLDAEQRQELEALLLEQKENALQAIRDKYAKIEEKKDKDSKKKLIAANKNLSDQKIKDAENGLNALKSIAGKESTVGKTAAIGKATINTYQGVSEVWRSPSTLPEPFATAAKVASTGVVLASGLSSVKSISSTKMAKGGFFDGPSHMNGGIDLGNGIEVEGGEYLSSNATMSNPQLSGLVQAANEAGNAGTSLQVGVTEERVAEIAASVVGSIPVVVAETDITETQRTVSVRESEFNG